MVKVRLDEQHGTGKLHSHMRHLILAALYVVWQEVFPEILSRKSVDSMLAKNYISLSLHPICGVGHFLQYNVQEFILTG